jgi:hypothetical protein
MGRRKARVSDFYSLGRTQPYLDFVDVPINTDARVFVDPTAMRSLESPFGQECASLVQHYFQVVLERIRDGKNDEARELVSALRERNEFHLGYSKAKSRGHAFGKKTAELVWRALSKSQASKSGLLQDLEDTCLLIEGIGMDMVSDAVCNIIRGPLLKYTQDMCVYYGIPLVPDVESGPIWNPQTEKWERTFLPLPVTSSGAVLLVPKILVRHQLSYEYQEYYRHYLLPVMQEEELLANTGLVELLKDGRRRVTKKALLAKYGGGKLAVVEQTLKRPQVLKKYKDDKEKRPPPPLNHQQISEIEDTVGPDWDGLVAELRASPTGRPHAKAYENTIEKALSAIFYPSLCSPIKQQKIHNGRKQIDITYTNAAAVGFFDWAAKHYPAPLIHVECKNYGHEIANPELDQIAGRFSNRRGRVGLLVCRSLENPGRMTKRCIDTAHDDNGFVIVLTDEDVVALMETAKLGDRSQEFPLLKKKFLELIM